jgi:hypothetical protein
MVVWYIGQDMLCGSMLGLVYNIVDSSLLSWFCEDTWYDFHRNALLARSSCLNIIIRHPRLLELK